MKQLFKNWALPLSLFLLPIVLINYTQLIVVSIILLFVSCVFHFKRPNLKEIPYQVYAMFLFYILHIVGLINTENFTYAGADLETKFSFGFFPLLFLFSYRSIGEREKNWAKYGFILGAGFAMIHSLVSAFLCDPSGIGPCFEPSAFGFQMHGTYLTAIYLFATYLLYQVKFNARSVNFILRLFYILLLAVSLFYIRSLSSVVCVVLLAALGVLKYFLSLKSWKVKAVVLFTLLISMLGMSQLTPIQRDIDATMTTVKDYFADHEGFIENKKDDNSSSTVRVVLYTMSAEVIGNAPFGVGTGDVKDKLYEVYEKYGYSKFVTKKYNAHSQFFQTTIALGYIGLILLVYLLFTPILNYPRTRNFDLLILSIIIIVSCAFESFLERQVGVIFFSFALFALSKPKLEKEV